jgi:MFS family permease
MDNHSSSCTNENEKNEENVEKVGIDKDEISSSNKVSKISEIVSGPAVNAVIFMLLIVLNLGVIMPIAPTFIEDHFAKANNGGVEIHCRDYKDKDTEPQCCKDASSKASFSQILCDSIASLFTFIIAPIVGQYSDAYGRMPYILPASCVIGLPSITLLLCDLGVFGLEPYYMVTMLSPLYLSLSLVMSYVADTLEPQNRATGFALVLGMFTLSLPLAY